MRPYSLNIKGKLFCHDRPTVMAILNLTPDSFYENSRAFESSEIERRVQKFVEQKVDFIDIGAFSTRPGAQNISIAEEIDRLTRGMEIVRHIAPDAVISVDTFRSEVAEKAVTELGCDIINDISGGEFDADMFSTVARLQVPYILTHNGRSFDDMHVTDNNCDITSDILQWFGRKIKQLCQLGVNDIIIDPGIGFAKTIEQNYRLISDLEQFQIFGRPILLGISRKSLLWKMLDISPDEALSATSSLNSFGLDRGADILRVHDVTEAKQCINIYEALHQKFNI